MKPYIVDVSLCVPDETYYPLNGRSKYNDVYSATSREELLRLLAGDGWQPHGIVRLNDGTISSLLEKTPAATERQLIAIAEDN